MAINTMVFLHDVKAVMEMDDEEYKKYVRWLGCILPDLQAKKYYGSSELCELELPQEVVVAHPIDGLSRVIHDGKRAECALCVHLV